MARGSTRSKDVNEITKQVIAEIVAEEYAERNITNDPLSLYVQGNEFQKGDKLYKEKKKMPTTNGVSETGKKNWKTSGTSYGSRISIQI